MMSRLPYVPCSSFVRVTLFPEDVALIRNSSPTPLMAVTMTCATWMSVAPVVMSTRTREAGTPGPLSNAKTTEEWRPSFRVNPSSCLRLAAATGGIRPAAFAGWGVEHVGLHVAQRSEERRVGEEGRSRWWPYH